MKSEKEYSRGLEFEIESNVAWVKGIGMCEDEDLVIPVKTDENCKVIGIKAFAFDNCKTIVSVNIPKSIEIVEEFAFSNCPNLKSVKLHYGLKEIWGFAFEHCVSLTSVEIPASVINIGNTPQENGVSAEEQLLREIFGEKRGTPGNPFKGCTKLRSIKVNSSNTVYHDHLNCLIETQKKRIVAGCKTSILPGDDSCEIIGEYAFWGCNGAFKYGLYAFEEPKIKIIERAAFAYCTDIQEISFPHTVNWIDSNAFEGCSSLSKIIFSNSLVYIGSRAFEGCVKLYKLELPKQIKKIGFDAFKNCQNLTSVTYDEHSPIYSINGGTFEGCISLMNLFLPKNLEKIEFCAFKACKNLQHIELPKNLEKIGECAFESCEHLGKVFIPRKVDCIEADAFLNCSHDLELLVCGITIKPENWDPNWNRKSEHGTYHKVFWESKEY